MLCSIVLGQVLPTMLLTNANADRAFLSILQSTLSSFSSDDSESPCSPAKTGQGHLQLEFRPTRDFAPVNGKDALSQLNILEDGIYQSEGENVALPSHNTRVQDDSLARRNNELRLGSFLNDLDSSPLTVITQSVCSIHARPITDVNGKMHDSLDVLAL